MAKGALFIIIGIGPSGAGKTAVVDGLLSRIPGSVRLVTSTSRSPRKGERHGEHYYFLDRADFERRREAHEFLEWNEYAGRLYGSSAAILKELLDRHAVVFAVLDVNGAEEAKKRYPDAVTIFLRTENIAELERRIRARSPLSDEVVRKRLATARKELAKADTFDHVVVNARDALDDTVRQIMEIVSSRR